MFYSNCTQNVNGYFKVGIRKIDLETIHIILQALFSRKIRKKNNTYLSRDDVANSMIKVKTELCILFKANRCTFRGDNSVKIVLTALLKRGENSFLLEQENKQ